MPDSIQRITRTANEIELENRSNQLWALVRNNQDSLDSERCTRMIRELVESSDVSRIEELRSAYQLIGSLKRELSTARKTIRELRKHKAHAQ